MKKFLKLLLAVTVAFLICLVIKLGILDFSVFESDKKYDLNYSGYYFNQLQQDEKEIYAKMDEAIKDLKNTIHLGSISTEGLTDKVGRVLSAYFYDNPEVYYISNEYSISTSDLKLFQFSSIELKYTIKDDEEIAIKNKQLNTAIDKIIDAVITDEMTDFEKEVAIHDTLVEQTKYYEYENIQNIPAIKHTAYGALVENEAVCDGYSKTFKLLLDEIGIECHIIKGITEGVAHAWNIVNIGNEYYHVDVTSDNVQKNKKHAIHAYFNLDDSSIIKTHTIDKEFSIPKCNSKNYDYYNKKDYYISSNENLYNKVSKIVTNQKNSKVLEVKLDEKHTVKDLIDTLYDLNFNNWRASGKSSVEYTQIQDKYIFIK